MATEVDYYTVLGISRTASDAETQNAERQPRCCPVQVAAGTPTTLATDSPIIIMATARPSRPRGARVTATSEATPK